MGAATRDVDERDPRGWRLGGGVTYGALAAARLGLRVQALIGVDATTSKAEELDLLRAAGVELALVRLAQGPAMENRAAPAGGRMQLVSRASSPLPVRELPVEWRAPPAVLLAPVANELPMDWAGVFPRQTLMALAWQGLLRRLVPGQPMVHLPLRRLDVIERADLAMVSADDARAGGAALRDLLSRPGQQLVVTHGGRGAVHLLRRRSDLLARYLPAANAATEVDATGAGDVFLAAWCAATLVTADRQRQEPWRPLYVAALAAALSVEEAGIASVPDLSSIRARVAAS